MNRNTKTKILKILMMIVMITLMILPVVFAGTGDDISGMKEIYRSPDTKTMDVGGKIITIVQYLCYGFAVIIFVVMGAKFIMSSPDEKADIKKKLISAVFGAILLFSVGTVVRVVANIGSGIG